jgi:hypothetical protein
MGRKNLRQLIRIYNIIWFGTTSVIPSRLLFYLILDLAHKSIQGIIRLYKEFAFLCKLSKREILLSWATLCMKGFNSNQFVWNFESLVHKLKVTLNRLNFVHKPLIICWKRHPHSLDFENINSFLFLPYHKYLDIVHKQKIYAEPLCEVERDLKFVQSILQTLYTFR